MANPTAGPYGSTGTLIVAAGADGPLSETTIEQAGFSNFRRVSNQIAPAAVGGSPRVYLSTYGTVPSTSQEMWTQILARGANGEGIDLIGHYSPSANPTFAEGEIDWAAADTIAVFNDLAGTGSQVGTSTTQQYAVNSFWAVAWHNVGSDVTIEQFLWSGSAWTLVQSRTTSGAGATLQLAGNFGLEGSLNSAVRLGDIMGGPFAPAATAPIVLLIPNRYVGPMALRYAFRRPQPWTVTPPELVNTTTPPAPLVIPNPNVGPMALRHSFRRRPQFSFFPGSLYTLFFNDSTTDSDAVVKTIEPVYADTTTESDALTKNVGKPETDTTTQSDAVAKNVGKPEADTTTESDTAVKNVGKNPSDTTTDSDAVAKNVGKPEADTTTESDAVAKNVGKPAADTTTSTDVFSRAASYIRAVADAVTNTDVFTKINGSIHVMAVALGLSGTINPAPSATGVLTPDPGLGSASIVADTGETGTINPATGSTGTIYPDPGL